MIGSRRGITCVLLLGCLGCPTSSEDGSDSSEETTGGGETGTETGDPAISGFDACNDIVEALSIRACQDAVCDCGDGTRCWAGSETGVSCFQLDKLGELPDTPEDDFMACLADVEAGPCGAAALAAYCAAPTGDFSCSPACDRAETLSRCLQNPEACIVLERIEGCAP